MLNFTEEASQLACDYVKNVEMQIGKLGVSVEPEYFNMVLSDIESYIRFFSGKSAWTRGSSTVEATDVEGVLKKFGKPEKFIKTHLKDPRTYINSQRITFNNLRPVTEKLAKTRMPKVLDAGCGWGRVSKKLLDYSSKDSEIIGVDLDKFSLRFGKNLIETADFVASDIQALPFKDRAFDLILCSGVIHEVKHKRGRCTATQEFFRTLKPDSMLHVTDAFSRLRIISALTFALQHFIGTVEWISGKDQVGKMLNENGFRITNTDMGSSRFFGFVTTYTLMAIKTPKQ